jgi:hypothetical protein
MMSSKRPILIGAAYRLIAHLMLPKLKGTEMLGISILLRFPVELFEQEFLRSNRCSAASLFLDELFRDKFDSLYFEDP